MVLSEREGLDPVLCSSSDVSVGTAALHGSCLSFAGVMGLWLKISEGRLVSVNLLLNSTSVCCVAEACGSVGGSVLGATDEVRLDTDLVWSFAGCCVAVGACLRAPEAIELPSLSREAAVRSFGRRRSPPPLFSCSREADGRIEGAVERGCGSRDVGRGRALGILDWRLSSISATGRPPTGR